MEKRLTIVISSREDSNEKLISNIDKTISCSYDLNFIKNDGVSLSSVYRQALIDSPNDIILFIHDDIEFLVKGWGKELIRLFENNQEYGIIGVAGSAEFDENAMWWNYNKKYGQVLHRNNGKSWLTTFSPLLKEDLKDVCVVDGLFIAVDKTRISKNFSGEIDGFNFYDIDFCLSNFLDKKTKIGVTTNIRLAHNSIGKLSENWYINKEIINNKYKDYYPIHV